MSYIGCTVIILSFYVIFRVYKCDKMCYNMIVSQRYIKEITPGIVLYNIGVCLL